MPAINVVLGYPDGHWNTWTAFSQAFLDEILTKGALPVRDADGEYYNMTWRADGVLMLNDCPVTEVFKNTCSGSITTVDDRRVQLYSAGKLVADLSAAEAFAYAPTSTWELWKGYYEAAGFTTGRTGTWTVGLPGDPPSNTNPPPDGNGNGTTTLPPVLQSSNTIMYALGGVILYALLLKR